MLMSLLPLRYLRKYYFYGEREVFCMPHFFFIGVLTTCTDLVFVTALQGESVKDKQNKTFVT